MAAKDERGRAGEARAARHLQDAGWQVLDRNWRCAQGELDLIAARGGELILVEVKTRRSDAFGHPLEAVDERKRRRLWQVAYAWMAAHPDVVQGRMLRLDVIAITGDDPATAVLEHLQDLR
ncbi:YraN family protein [Microbacterium sp. zg.Y1090]|uniref:YraN family protein n=1 Tax=Microbacterium TaxID=33882 RepID=UPI00214CC9B0|nr:MULTISPECIES: YraN family protein [unclassified Microbacterium]MCR2811643.1 YraN family protein [Microbacterium sp. zg.Y1084]MCR2818935.1 YraN family protein [Microbacterium sp. zg.Y1090]MDL5487584.1 YraN family protein [Microbacterium sp. zg-Y1211]WIM27242.1 YraN family protein [Microbacterium sp. zg-Y1090]